MHEKNDWFYRFLDCGRHAAYAFFYKPARRIGYLRPVIADRL